MVSIDRPIPPLTPEAFEARLRSLSQAILGDAGVDDLEVRHLLEILTRSSLLLREGYDPGTLGRILAGERRPASLLEALQRKASDRPDGRRLGTSGVPDVLKSFGDKCLYDVGLAGRQTFRGIDLAALGPRSYSLASQVLALLAEDRTLRDFYDRNLLERLPIDEEILFLRQCALRFQIHAQILQAFREEEPAARVVAPGGAAPARSGAAPDPAPPGDRTSRAFRRPAAGSRPVEGTAGRAPTVDRRGAAATPRPPADRAVADEGLAGLGREDRLARYERALLFSALDISDLRARLKENVVEQEEAVDQICNDLAVFALGTRGRPRPQSYLFVGPTGVGKNYLIETLVGLLEGAWGVEVPVLLLEGPQYTYPSDVGELKGSTRGFIRSDEEGLLAEFHDRARKAPLSFLLIDEVEKAHPQLTRFFLSLMDRGTTMDNKGRLLRFPATILAYTSNLGYSEERMQGRPIGYGQARRTGTGQRRAASRNLTRGLPPEFLNRLRVIHFAPLSRASAARILDQEAARIASRYRALHGIDLTLTDAAREALIDLGFSEEYGARHLVRQADRVLNVDVGLLLQAGASPLSEEGRRLLDRIREAREGRRAIDEEALRADVARQTRLRAGAARVRVDWDGARFVHRVDEA